MSGKEPQRKTRERAPFHVNKDVTLQTLLARLHGKLSTRLVTNLGKDAVLRQKKLAEKGTSRRKPTPKSSNKVV